MIQFIATFSNPETVVILPNPEFGNTNSLMSSVIAKQAIDGTLYAYKKTKEHQKLEWTIIMTPLKAEELKAAIDYYMGQYIKIVDMDNKVWRVLLANDVFKFTSKLADKWVETQLEFQGVRVNG